MKHSTTKPTRAESERISACKEGPCMACMAWQESDSAPLGFAPVIGCDFHHLISGSRRRGHMFGIGLCPWHHRAVPNWGCTAPEMRTYYGPSLLDGSKTFHMIYGSDEELLGAQNLLLTGALGVAA